MKKILYFVIVIFALTSCSENERLIYESGYKAYFKDISKSSDSITVSLFNKPRESQYNVKVSYVGERPKTDKKIRLEVDQLKSTAKEGIHYKALEPYYIIPADSIEAVVALTLYNDDPKMNEEHFILALRIVQTEDVDIAYENRCTARVRFSNMLKAPEGTGYYDDLTAFKKLFGQYSKVKHGLIINIVGHDFWDGDYGNYGGEYGIYQEKSYYAPYARALYIYISENEVYDENGVLIEVW